jgi:hypothetical protein
MDLVFDRLFAFGLSQPPVLTHIREFYLSVSQTPESLVKIHTIRRYLLAKEYPDT